MQQDADKDGRVSRDEYKGRPRAFARLDVNKDGFLDRKDLRAARNKTGGNGGNAEKKKDGSKEKDDAGKGRTEKSAADAAKKKRRRKAREADL